MKDGSAAQEHSVPASVQQKGIWFHSLTSQSYYWNFIQKRFFRGHFSVDALKQATEMILKRHSSLRSNFRLYKDELYQIVNPSPGIGDHFMHITYNGTTVDAFIRSEIEEEENFGFDLEHGSLVRFKVLELPTFSVFILNMNHIITDSISMDIFWNELMQYYNSLMEGETPDPGIMPSEQYSGYSVRQHEFFGTAEYQQQKEYWMHRLSQDLPALDLAFYKAGSPPQLYHAEWELDRHLADDIRTLSLKKKVLHSSVFQLAYVVFLHKYAGLSTIAIGNIISGRGLGKKSYRDVIGLFAGRLVHIHSIRPDDTLEELLGKVNQEVIEGFRHSDVSYEELARQVSKRNGTGLKPLTRVIFNMVKGTGQSSRFNNLEEFDAPGYANSQVGDDQYDIGISVFDNGRTIKLRLDLTCDEVFSVFAGTLLQNYLELLRECVNHPAKKVRQVTGLSPAEFTLLQSFNGPAITYPGGKKTLVDLFTEQVMRTPFSPALVFRQQQLSYRELDERSSRLAHYLRRAGIQEEHLVAVCLERSVEMMVALLGILKAGAAYVPLDPAYPQERMVYMLEDTSAKIILTSRESRLSLPQDIAVRVMLLDADWADIAAEPADRPFTQLRPDHLAYVIYTSGSTGRPKGVMNQHDGVVNRLLWAQRYFGLDEKDSVLQKTTYCFDVSVWELFWPLLAGARLVMAEPAGHKDPTYLKKVINDQKITLIHFVPSMLEAFLLEIDEGGLPSLQHMLCSGEELKPRQVDLVRRKLPHIDLHNLYGPTEAAVDVTCLTIAAGDPHRPVISIGKPIDNVTIQLVNADHQLTPPGFIGEICIGGVQVARGYLHRPELTAEKFIADTSFPEEQRTKRYCTGDLGRWLPDGQLEYLGRKDQQVKIRGYRIEPGEIEAMAQQSGLVQQCVVLAREDAAGNRRLIGYAVAAQGFDQEILQNHLRCRLPEYMVPAMWIHLDAIPLTGSGKVDGQALLQADHGMLSRSAYVAPRNEPEQVMSEIWQELLGVKNIGIRDNFFELGGDSIITIQVASRARRAGYVIRPKDIFSYQSIERLSAAVLSRQVTSEIRAEQGVLQGECGLFPMQQWYLEREERNPAIAHFNHNRLIGIDKKIEVKTLSLAIKELIRHHDSLRFQYQRTAEGWKQYYSANSTDVQVCDLTGENPDSLSVIIPTRAAAYQESLDILQGNITRVVLFRTPIEEEKNRLLLIVHHLAVDGVSWHILLEDLEQLLQHISRGPGMPAFVKSSSCRDWYEALKEYGQSARLLSQQAYWNDMVIKGQPLPADMVYERPVMMKDSENIIVRLSAARTAELLQDVPRAYHTEINDILLAALAGTVTAWSGDRQVLIGLEGHGREDSLVTGIDTHRTVGWFTSLFPVLLASEPGISPGQLIKEVKEGLRSIPDKGIGFGVLKYLNKIEGLGDNSPWQMLFNYMGQLDNLLDSSELFSSCTEQAGATVSSSHRLPALLSLNGWISGGALQLHWTYSRLHYRQKTIQQLADRYISCLEKLIDHCVSQPNETFTPSDYGLGAEISCHELDRFLATGITGQPPLESIYRMSGLQEGILFHGMYHEQVKAYIGQLSCELSGLRPEILLRSWEQLIQEHTILRTAFYPAIFQVPVQCVFRTAMLPVTEIDLSAFDAQQQQARIEAYEEEDRRRPFDLAKAPLMRLALIRRTEADYHLVWTSHHLLMDGWSMAVLLDKLQGIYQSLLEERHIPQEEDRYADYIDYLKGRDKEKEERYWRDYLSAIDHPPLLPFIGLVSDRNNGIGKYAEETIRLDNTFAGGIQRYAQRLQITVNTLMQGIWSYLLYAYTGKENIVFGVTVSGRPADMPGVEQRVGMYINTLPFCVRVDPDAPVGQWLRDIQSGQGAGLSYQYSPLSDIRKWTGIGGDLFDSLLVFENYPVRKKVAGQEPALEIKQPRMTEQSNYPLSIRIGGDEEMWIGFSYNTRLLDGATVQRIAGHFRQVLTQLTNDQPARLGALRLLSPEEEWQLLEAFNDTAAVYPADKTLVHLIREQVSRKPDHLALVAGYYKLTYHELELRSNRLAHYLCELGVKEDTPVAICAERSPEMIIGILGILKAGGAYVPIDPTYPLERISYILEDTHATIAVSSRQSHSLLPEGWPGRVVLPDDDQPDIARQPTGHPATAVRPENLAYIIYTSGSTGRPKGVMVEHRNAVSLLSAFQQTAGMDDGPGTSVCPYVFDVSVWEIFTCLCYGNTLHLLDEELIYEPASLARYLIDHRIGTAYIPPVILPEVISCLEAVADPIPLARLLVGVMPIRQGILQRFMDRIPWLRIINGYGPTETTICATFYPFRRTADPDSNTPIGKPVPNNKIYILDARQHPVPIGVAGEIYITGAGVGRGYWDHRSMTEERFLRNIFPGSGYPYLYRTGDLGKWLPDGNIVYLRRIDHQVKIRGYRVELGEIESMIDQSALVRQCVVTVRSDNAMNQQLIGYFTADDTLDTELLRDYLLRHLPEYMVPGVWIQLESLPVTRSGKIDRGALPEPFAGKSAAAFVAPRNEMESELVLMWQELLELDQVGITDDFLSLGGHSLLAIKFVAQAEEKFKVRIQLKMIFDLSTIMGLAEYIGIMQGGGEPATNNVSCQVFEL
ncbi:amino acid adenylation domain-containing protein [Flavitalea sp. BT771]|uniref:non-ribosomal peptide synthetase n=1 Tax=Flavitalea sp. BT771 TaxID=3063329 RepID=UPI0026E45C5D|nr:non-ribosomal peptide synthetase [Flavitalea sp. BT771]MDO6431640.1 amino acid adenylation domain-containing protein [Flavitalea sp. BT771]MDV6220548.1 amino acid adenylation domain-containing protein [Flavitalea sp. BT771]